MGLSEYNRLRAREAEKAKLEAKPVIKPAPVEILEKIEPVEAVEIIESENETPIIEPCEAEIYEADKPKKKTDAEKLKRKK